MARLHPHKVIIFGSYAKGGATIRSDLDVLVIKDTELPMARRADDLRPLLTRIPVTVDIHVYTPGEVTEYGKERFSFISSILRSGVTVFEK